MLFLVPAAHWVRCVQADRFGVGVQGELMKPGVRVEHTENTTRLGQLLQHVYKLLDHRESLRNCLFRGLGGGGGMSSKAICIENWESLELKP